ncbi:hypothetical protein AMTR_s00019p00244740 [Amborella trichopoda]|uniref:AAA+ ATPase domain-containing protein n=2 Tax=Amborella trichopoda TaxID=13333 RepID=W1PJX5_AMBTC|nr:hypothetical protein AMTR_s00019p00244740 [Amborella trichopoda]
MWVQWKLCSSGPSRQEKRYFELMFHKDYHDLALEFYIPYVFEKGAEVQGAKRVLCTNRSMNGDGGLWSTVDFHLPSTFDTIAVNNEVKNSLKKDLVKFSEAKELYVEAGRAWKRSYLIHGPSGTGKTTLVAAIANELCFNLYDIDLGSVHNNFHLRKLLISTRERSVIVFEDIDKWVVKREGAENQRVEEGYIIQKIGGGEALITMTGLLNLIDGLWSSCFLCEKVMVFTATNIENLDPSLLRPGRMDMHMTLTYTRPLDFEALTNKYFDLENDEIEVSIRTNMQKIKDLLNNLNIIPAEIAEVFMRYSGDPAKAMEMLMWKLNGTIV